MGGSLREGDTNLIFYTNLGTTILDPLNSLTSSTLSRVLSSTDDFVPDSTRLIAQIARDSTLY